MSDIKTKKVLNVRTHVGGLHGKTSYDHAKDKAQMEITPVGVLISIPGNGHDVLVPWPNVTEVIVAKDEEEKRGPGRPPGPRAA